ncbi:MAG: hypothetical protein IJT35_02440 [Paludibacteraceae bacterium]|nr:hypothetical protein [Paludibacteraceae bacterium]
MDIRRVKHFGTEAEFVANRCVLPIPSVAYCKETGEVYFRKKTKLLPVQIVLCDNDEGKRVYVLPSEYNAANYPLSRYTPEGIVVISEQFTPDGRAVMMSLVNMSCKTPETGKASNSGEDIPNIGYDIWLRYGGYSNENDEWIYEDIPELENFGNHKNVYVLPNGSVKGGNNWGYLPSDSYHASFADSEDDNAADGNTHWCVYAGSARIPSPFDSLYGHNHLYGFDGKDHQKSFLSDLDGYANTQILLNRETYQPNWETDSEIINLYNGDFRKHHPAALCCARYHVGSTEAGDWYFPAIGELGCVMPRFSLIQAALQAVANVDASLAVPLGESFPYLSSTEFSQSSAYNLDTYGGGVFAYGKVDCGLVRAFCRLPRI